MNALLLDLPVHALALPGMSQESLAHEVKFMLASSRAGVPTVANLGMGHPEEQMIGCVSVKVTA